MQGDADESLIDELKNDAKETIKDAASEKAEETFENAKDSLSDAWDSFTGNTKEKFDDFIDGDKKEEQESSNDVNFEEPNDPMVGLINRLIVVMAVFAGTLLTWLLIWWIRKKYYNKGVAAGQTKNGEGYAVRDPNAKLVGQQSATPSKAYPDASNVYQSEQEKINAKYSLNNQSQKFKPPEVFVAPEALKAHEQPGYQLASNTHHVPPQNDYVDDGN